MNEPVNQPDLPRHVRSRLVHFALVMIVLGLLCLRVAVRAQETVWYDSLGVEDGLSQSFATAVAQDRDGFLWLGTVSGLNRFDGYEFSVYSHIPDAPGSLSDNVVRALHVDSSGGVWVGTQGGLDQYDSSTGQFVHYLHDPENAGSPEPGQVGAIASDRSGRVWFATLWFDRSVLHCLEPATGSVERYLPEVEGQQLITLIEIDSADRLWLGTSKMGGEGDRPNPAAVLAVYDGCSGIRGGQLPEARHPVVLPAGSGPVVTMAEDLSGRLWFGQERGGVTRFDPQTGLQVALSTEPDKIGSLDGDSVLGVAVDPVGVVWVLTEGPASSSGEVLSHLQRVDPESVRVTRINLQPKVPRPADSAKLQGLAVDRTGVVWLSSNAGGVRHFDAALRNFELYRPGHIEGMSHEFVRAVCLGRDDLLWIGTPKGLDCLVHPKETWLATGPSDLELPPLPSPDVQAILEDRRGVLWVACGRSVLRWDRDSGSVRVYEHDPKDPGSLADDTVQVIHEDHAGRLWFGTGGSGLSVLDPGTARFAHFRYLPPDTGGLPDNTIHALLSDQRGRLWVGTGAGLAVIDGTAGDPSPKRIAEGADQLGQRTVLAIAEDPGEQGILWVGSGGLGLTRLDLATGDCEHFTSRNSDLPDDTIYGILVDRRGMLWMSTNHGLVRYDPRSGRFASYGVERHLQSLEFNARAYFQAPDGEMFFGGIAGLNSFRPEGIKDNLIPPLACITKAHVLRRSGMRSTSPYVPVYERGMREGPLVLGPHERDLRFEYVALHFSNPRLNRCAYWLEGYDADWRDPVFLREATYTNLKPGRYVFHVRALSSHGVWGESTDSLAFVIRPPFYATFWFSASCGLALVGILLGSHHWRVRQLRRRGQELDLKVNQRTAELRKSMALIEEQARHLRELDQAKSRFFANISHEFRTPLTLTMGPLQDMRDGLYGPLPGDMNVELDLALDNTRRLLDLVEQLLTLARLDAGKLTIDTRMTDLGKFLGKVVVSFETLARKQEVHLVLDLPPAPVQFPVDADKLEQVMVNLLSNAFKHVPPGGRVTVRFRGGVVAGAFIEVEDTGPGIRPEDLPHLFKRFFQVNESNRTRSGTGIGLSLARELVELHGGRLEVESRLGKGTTFIVHLPHEAKRA